MPQPAHACPCCGHLTLVRAAALERCPVCLWRDDGQDDVDAHLHRGASHASSLWQARTHFLMHGACEASALSLVRQATAEEPRLRRWDLLDDRAVELIPSSDVTPWNLLHDGEIATLVRRGERVSMTIDIAYLRSRLGVPGDVFRLELLDCAQIDYAPYHGVATCSLEEIGRAGPSIVSAEHEGGVTIVWGSDGELRLRYRSLALTFDDGSALALDALDECARAYWESWQSHHQLS